MNPPSARVRGELAALLETDTSRTGEVYRLTRQGLGPDHIARELGVSTSGFVSNNRTIARGLLDGEVPGCPTAAGQVASKVRRFAKESALSAETREYLSRLLSALDSAAETKPVRSNARALGRVLAPSPRGSKPPPPGTSLRGQVEAELRARLKELVDGVADATGIEADDYWRIHSSSSPMDEMADLVVNEAVGRTFKALQAANRLDLTLESQLLAWAQDLPVRADMVEAARARLDYYQSR